MSRAVRICDMDEGTAYTANSPEDCRDEIDRMVYEKVVAEGDSIQQGHTLGVPVR